MTKEEIAYKKIQRGWNLIDDGERILIDLWLKKNKLPERFFKYFDLASEGISQEIALHFCGDPITDNWDISNRIEFLLRDNLENNIIQENTEESEIAIEILKTMENIKQQKTKKKIKQ